MKFFVGSLLLAVFCFVLSGVAFKYTNFSDVAKLEQFKGFKNFSLHYSNSGEAEAEDGLAKVTEKKFFQANDINTIDLSLLASNVEIGSSDTDQVFLDLEYYDHENYRIQQTVENGILKIYLEKGDGIESYKFKKSKVSLSLPSGLKPDVKIKTMAGDLDLEGVYLRDFEAEMAAGDISFKAVSAQNVDLEAAAGNIKLKSADVLGRLEIQAAAGNIEVELINESPNVEIEAAAGKVDFKLAEGVKKNFKLKAKTSLGKVNVSGYDKKESDTYTYGGGKGFVEIEAAIGKISVD